MAKRSGVTIKFNHLPKIRRQVEPRAKAVIKKLIGELRTVIEVSMEGSKSGRSYGGHQASAPGDAPAIDTGELFTNMAESTEDGGLTGVLEINTEYAIHLEFGTSKMEPRPFARPAVAKMEPRVREAFRQLARL